MSERPRDDSGGLIRTLGLLDVVAMTVVGVVSLRWVARAARAGAPSVTLWALAWLVFFLPLARVVTTLSARYPDQGGLYAWTRRAFGPVHGFLCGWCLWVNNLFYFPSLLLFGVANAALALGGASGGAGANSTVLVVSVLAALWFCVALNVVGFSTAKWLQNIGSIGTWLPALILIGCGAVALSRFGSATSFAPADLLPRGDRLTTISLWSAVCFAFSGFELTALVGQEVHRPSRTIPLGVVLAGTIVTLIYVLGSTAVLVSVPASSLVELSGIVDAIDLVASRIGLGRLGPLVGALLAVSALAMTSSWFAGSARVPFVAGVDRVLPAAFGRLHPRFRTPHVVLVVQGIVATAVFLVSVLLAVSGARPSIEDAYDVMVNLSILLYFVPYIYLFAAYVRLAPQRAEGERTGRLDGRLMVGLVAAAGLAATGTSLALLFVPPPGTNSVAYFEANLLGQAALIVGIGFALYWRARRRAGPGR